MINFESPYAFMVYAWTHGFVFAMAFHFVIFFTASGKRWANVALGGKA